jgi:hypothetical protein
MTLGNGRFETCLGCNLGPPTLGPRGHGRRLAAVPAVLLGLLLSSPATAQELEPRAYSPAPIGTQFLLVGYGHQTGDVSADPAVPIQNIKATINSASLGYGYTFDLAGRQASAALVLPYVHADVSGEVSEASREVTRSALADLRLRFWVGLAGAPALTPRQFAARKRGALLGAALIIVAPTGQYDPDRLINIGTNRWAFKPEVGLSYPTGPWTLEGAAGVWLFTTNHDHFGGGRLEQDPLASFQAHVSYTFRPGLWLSGSATYFVGGRTARNGVEQDTLQRNTRYGLTLSLPLGQRQSAKLAWATGLSTHRGGDFTTFAVAWQRVWF